MTPEQSPEDDTARRLAEIRQDSIERRPLAQSDVPFLLDLLAKRDATIDVLSELQKFCGNCISRNARIAKLEAALREIASRKNDSRIEETPWIAEEALK